MGKYKFIEERVETMSSSELKIFLNILKSRSKELMSTLESVRGSRVYQAHLPTCPSGYWLFGFASKKYHPLNDLDAER